MLDVSSSKLLCSKLIFHLSFLILTSLFLHACRNYFWKSKLVCQLLTYLRQSITFGSKNLAIGVLAFLPQHLTITCEHLGNLHCIMFSYS
jgi:hypothetical protein